MEAKNRDAEKRTLIEQFGGGCASCGYNRSIRALHFHHTDASEKHDWSGQRGNASRAELAAHPERFKLLCATCHIEEHERLDVAARLFMNCVKCGTQVQTRQYLIARGRKRYCSHTCQHADRVAEAQRILEKRVYKYVRKTDECWWWTGYVIKIGQVGAINVTLPDGTHVLRTARGIVYEFETGTRREKLNVSCKNSLCVNPAHCLIRK